MPTSDSHNDLDKKVGKWLHSEGYPLEFAVAHLFSRNRFAVRQGEHVKDPKTQLNREVDVVAYRDCRVSSRFIRIYHIVECKWSVDKPWIVFTSNKSLSAAACVTQTIASELAGGILWKDAGLDDLHDLSLFATPNRSGFGGRQAFSTDNNDKFYSALNSVISLSTHIVNEYDRNSSEGDDRIPKDGAIAFPLIVVQAPLYEAYFDPTAGEVRIERVESIRCHWRGSTDWDYHSTVDVVSFDALPAVLERRSIEVETLQRILELSWEGILEAEKSNTIEGISVTQGARGIVGTPTF